MFNSDKVKKALLKKGFEEVNKDHKYFIYKYNNIEVLHTKVSHGKKSLSKSLIGQMSRQCRLSKNDFFDLINCPLSQELYLEILKGKGVLD